MKSETIPLINLALAALPAGVVIAVLFRWGGEARTALYGMARMFIQLLLVGYILNGIFSTPECWPVILVLCCMIGMASWISLRTMKERRKELLLSSLGAITLGGGVVLALIVYGVLRIEPWYAPRHIIPLAGMIFTGAMNSVSLAGERYFSEVERGEELMSAAKSALRTALITNTNVLFAVGLVSLPGMMTGQILSGVSPLIAARYQIMVMLMLYGASGLSALLFLVALLRSGQRVKSREIHPG